MTVNEKQGFREGESGSKSASRPWGWKTALLAVLAVGITAFFVLIEFGERNSEVMGTNGVALSSDGTRIAFTRVGSGPVVIIVDGAFCFRKNGPSAALAKEFAKHFTVYYYDRRGRGESGDSGSYTIQREVDDLQSVINSAGETPYVLGISSGAGLALQAASSGVRMQKLALYEPPYVTSTRHIGSMQAYRSHLQELLAAGDRAGAVRYFLTDIFRAPKLFAYAMPIIMPRAWKYCKSTAPALIYDLTILDDKSVLTDRAKDITVPTLVVGGTKSPSDLQIAVKEVAAALPNAKARFLEGQTHNVSPEATVPVLESFFTSTAN